MNQSSAAAAATAGYAAVLARVTAASARAGRDAPPRLVSVSKFQPASSVLAAYGVGCRHFAENYVQEVVDKARSCPPDVRWHFVGQLQSNKARALVAGVPSLWAVESVDSEKLATLLERAAAGAGRGTALLEEDAATAAQPLRVFVQVNTSGEAQKGGVEPGGEATRLCAFILKQCPHLHLQGLMTLGRLGDPARVFFDRLVEERDAVSRTLHDELVLGGGGGGARVVPLELSMGMSGDFEVAIECGATSVRVGSAIFGERPPRAAAAAVV